MKNTQAYLKAHEKQHLTELIALLKIPSISADPIYAAEVRNAAKWVADALVNAGLSEVSLMETEGFPVVYGERIVDPNAPTVLIYGHYDVPPADPVEFWDHTPFSPLVKDDKVYARGAADDKGQFFMHVKAVEGMIKSEELPCNVKFLIEGEEEVGSAHLEDFVKQHKELLQCDVILISDTALISNDNPSITSGLKGLSYLEVEVTGPNRDLHSGTFGGAVANPINVLCDMIASLKNDRNEITIPGFYDKVIQLSEEDRAEINRAPFSLAEYKGSLGVEEVSGEEGYTTIERTGIRPTLDVNGIWGGYIGEGAKTVLPSKAHAKISMRLVPDQNSNEITRLFTEHFKAIAPKSVKVKVTPHHGGEPALTDLSSPGYLAASDAMEKTFGKKPIPIKQGGSIPIVALFKKELQAEPILMGFGLDSDAIHSPNEHFGLFNFYKGIETIPYFFSSFVEHFS